MDSKFGCQLQLSTQMAHICVLHPPTSTAAGCTCNEGHHTAVTLLRCRCCLTCSGLVVGRLLVGLGVGASAIVVPAYLAEIAPADKRGAVVQAYEVSSRVLQHLSVC